MRTLRREDQWRLDVLGNWNGNDWQGVAGPLPGRYTHVGVNEPGLTGAPFTTERRDVTDAQNRLLTQYKQTGSGAPVQVHLAFDAAGNLTCDGVYYYQYDAWNRLVQVNRAEKQYLPSGQTVLASDGVTSVDYIWAPQPGRMLKHSVYDGLAKCDKGLRWHGSNEAAVSQRDKRSRNKSPTRPRPRQQAVHGGQVCEDTAVATISPRGQTDSTRPDAYQGRAKREVSPMGPLHARWQPKVDSPRYPC